MKFYYPAVFKKETDGSFSVTFPDLSGCSATGEDYEHALANAKEAEINWLTVEVFEEMNQPPYVSDVSEIHAGENEKVQLVAVNIRFMEGWDE